MKRILALVIIGVIGTLSVAAVREAVAQQPAVAAEDVEQNGESLLSLTRRGGPVMIPLGVFSIFAVTIGLERLLSLRQQRVVPPDFVSGLKNALPRNDPDIDKGMQYCEQSDTTAGGVFRAALQKLGQDAAEIEKTIAEAAGREIGKMRRSLRGLSVIARVSPLLGLLGTVFGMIKAFQKASAATGLGRADLLAKGIYEALVTTAAGLSIAIPTLLVFHYLTGRVDKLADELEDVGSEFVEHYVGRRENPS